MGRKHRPQGLGSQSLPRLAPSVTTPHSDAAAGTPHNAGRVTTSAHSSTDSAPLDAGTVVSAGPIALQNHWLRSAFETSREPLLVFDTLDRLLDCNRATCLFFSSGKDQLVSRTIVELAELAVKSLVNARLAPRAAAGDWRLYSIETTAPSLGSRDAINTAAPVTPAAEGITVSPTAEAAGATVESSLQIEIHHALSQPRLLLRDVIEGLPVGVWVIDLAGSVVAANSAGRRMWGGARNDWRRDGWWAESGEKIEAENWPGMQVLASGAAMAPTVAEVRTFDGVRKSLLISATPLRDDQQRLIGAVCVHQDISLRVTAERAARQELQRNDHLERLASIGTLAAGIAHEINNPLGTILLSAELGLASAIGENPELSPILTSIVTDAKRCGRIVHNLLRFSARLASEKSPGDLTSVVREILPRISSYAAQRGVALILDLIEPLPLVLMNAEAMEQAVTNLVRNAIDATTAAETQVEISTQALTTTVRITIRDHGQGINAQEHSQLFDPFYTTRRNAGSVGLGLSVAHGVVRDHDGKLRIESTPGQGATVYLELPTASHLMSGDSAW